MAITIHARFERLEDVSLVDAYDEVGVYVLWSGKAAVRPSYIGEGNVLKRFVDHLGKSWAARPLRGMMALIPEGTELEAKWRALAIEKVLLHIAGQVDRFPANNSNPGVMSGITKLVRHADHNVRTIRFVFNGYDLCSARAAMAGTSSMIGGPGPLLTRSGFAWCTVAGTTMTEPIAVAALVLKGTRAAIYIDVNRYSRKGRWFSPSMPAT